MIHVYRTDSDLCMGYFDEETCEARFILNEVEAEIQPLAMTQVDFHLAIDLPPGIVALVKAFVFQHEEIICYPLHIASHSKIIMLFRNMDNVAKKIEKGCIMTSVSFLRVVPIQSKDVFLHFVGR